MPTNSPFIVAEMSANHLGNLKRALAIVDAAADAGADAIKVQTWSPGRMCIDRSYTLDHGPWAGRKLAELYEEAFLPWDWHYFIFEHARRRGLIPFSAGFDREAVDFLETLGVDRHKVASFELTDLPLIRYMASKGKPMILSTGMATMDEITAASDAVKDGRRFPRITVLHCTSAYPAPLEAANLARMNQMARCCRWSDVGLSDHSIDSVVAVAATALGASMIEKHLTLSRADGGPDAGFSLEPEEFAQMVQAVRKAALAWGTGSFGAQPGEDPSLRRSLWMLRDISKGELLRLGDNVITARPALGLAPGTNITGRSASRDLKANTPLQMEDLA